MSKRTRCRSCGHTPDRAQSACKAGCMCHAQGAPPAEYGSSMPTIRPWPAALARVGKGYLLDLRLPDGRIVESPKREIAQRLAAAKGTMEGLLASPGPSTTPAV